MNLVFLMQFPEECHGVNTLVEYEYTAEIRVADSELVWNKSADAYSPGSIVEITVNSGLIIDTTYKLSVTLTGTTGTGSAETSASLTFRELIRG